MKTLVKMECGKEAEEEKNNGGGAGADRYRRSSPPPCSPSFFSNKPISMRHRNAALHATTYIHTYIL